MSDLAAELETIDLGDQRLNRWARSRRRASRRPVAGPLNYQTRRGLYLHPTLAVTPKRLCPGVLDAWSWTREPGGLGADKGQHPIEAQESIRWLEGYQRVNELQAQTPDTQLIYMGDREADYG